MLTKEKTQYIDITNEWLNKPHSFGVVKEAKYYEYNGKKYYVDNKMIVLDYSKHELEVANLLTETFGGVIYMVPKVINNGLGFGVKTPIIYGIMRSGN